MFWEEEVLDKLPVNIWYEANGVMLHAHHWSHDNQATIIFIHGAIANNVWWQHIACQLTTGQVFSVDLSGHGLSQWAPSYNLTQHAKEIIALLEAYRSGPVYLIGHSYGGAVAALVASMIQGVTSVMVDTPLSITQERKDPEPRAYQKPVYPTVDEAIKRFRPIPRQPIQHPKILDFIARNSVRESDGGYCWQFDPAFNKRHITEAEQALIQPMLVGMPYWYVELSPFATPELLDKALALGLQPIEVPNAYHAVMIDNPGHIMHLIDELLIESDPGEA